MAAIFDKLRALFSKNGSNEEPWPSVVLLLRRPPMLTDDVILEKAKKALVSDSVQLTHLGNVRLLFAKNLPFTFFEEAQKYSVPGLETSVERQRAWNEHTAWIAVDFSPGQKVPRSKWASFYTALMTLVVEFWDDNCAAMYFPAEGVTVPNLGSWKDSMRWSKANGTNFAFLAKQKNS
jgi:hypothetical protein